MSIWSCKLMKENELSRPMKFFISVGLLIFMIVAAANAIQNVTHDVAHQPLAFIVVLIGFLCFAFAKLSVIGRTRLVSFGTRSMTEGRANFYRVGYYLMGLGFILTFA